MFRERRRDSLPARSLFAGAFALALLVHQASPAAAAVGELDSSFNGTGRLILNPTSDQDYFEDVVIQPSDQKIVGVGRIGGIDSMHLIMRFNPDGSPDATFGGGDGMVTTNFGAGEDSALAVALQSDGKIVAVGDAPGQGGKFAVARYNTDGSPDLTFSGDGRTKTNFTPGNDFAWDVAVQPADQKIVVVGRTGASDGAFAVVRYNTNGSLDGTFSDDGKTTVNLTSGEDNGLGLALQADGRIVLAGFASGAGGQIGLARLLTNGSLDASFSDDGMLLKNLTTAQDVAWSVAVQPADQKIVVAGRSGRGGGSMVALRYNPNGTRDSTFSGDGAATVDLTSDNDQTFAMALQDDGHIVLAGTADDEFFAVARLTAGGAVDDEFGYGTGSAIVNLSPVRDIALGVAIQADGNYVAAGFVAGFGGGRIGVIRLLGT